MPAHHREAPATPLRAGIIGAGSWAVASHIPNLRRRAGEVAIVAACRHGEKELAALAERFAIPVLSEDFADVLAARLDLCIVSSPTAMHYRHAKGALEAGAHVLVEKPMTVAPDEARDLVTTAERRRRHLVVAFGWNHKPLMRDAHRLMRDHGVGRIEHVSIRMASFTRELLGNLGPYPRAAADAMPEQRTWTDPALSGGGYAQAQLSHALGAALWLTDLRGSEAFAFMASPLEASVELHDAIALRFDGGAIGTLSGASTHADIGAYQDELTIDIVGDEGAFSLDMGRSRAWLGRRDGEWVADHAPAGGSYDCNGPVQALVDLALGRTQDNQSPGELGQRTVEILDAVYRSAATNAPATVR